MILLVHMLFGVAVASLIPSIFLALLASLLSHYFLDAIPHIEYMKFETSDMQKKLFGKISVRNAAMIILDFLIGLIIVLLLAGIELKTLIAVFLATLPDTIFILSILGPNKFLDWHDRLDRKIHFLHGKKISVFWRIFSQTTIVVISAIILQAQ